MIERIQTMHAKTKTAPKVGWGILEPDPRLSRKTLALVKRLEALSKGQKDALLSRAVDRYLATQRGDRSEQEPTRTDMVNCSSALSNFWFDLLGKP